VLCETVCQLLSNLGWGKTWLRLMAADDASV
jgi:hypothetical protein